MDNCRIQVMFKNKRLVLYKYFGVFCNEHYTKGILRSTEKILLAGISNFKETMNHF